MTLYDVYYSLLLLGRQITAAISMILCFWEETYTQIIAFKLLSDSNVD